MGKKPQPFLNPWSKKGDSLKIKFDVQQTDRHGRLFGYVYLKDGGMLNEEIAIADFASLATVPPNVKYQVMF